MDDKTKLLIFGVLLVVSIVSLGGKEAILPVGGVINNADCTWATNVDPMELRADGYRDSAAWIVMDKDGDGVWEAYGQRSFGTIFISYTAYISNYNSYGDDIRSPSSTYDTIYVGSTSSWTTFERGYGAAINAIIPECAQSPIPPPSSQSVCTGVGACWNFGNLIVAANEWINRDRGVCT